MQRTYTRRTIVGTAAAAFVAAVPAASAQTADTTAATTTSATATAVKKRPPAEATPEMIAEAIQRSKARSEKLRTSGTLERFGSEEPFVYDPTK